MLNTSQAIATLAVKDLKAAAAFYEGKLGFVPQSRQDDELISYASGNSVFNVYRSRYAGTNEATALSWPVKDVEGTIKELKAKGIAFEHYDMPGMTLQGDVHVSGSMKVAWFKDPDGNILNIINEP
jgi:catechol 2,3-dioxygenase-like lactoylglutathione lyase family enzyme